MTTIAMGSSAELSEHIIDLMHEFRHTVFVKRLGWSLPAVEGRECDHYDTPAARYVVVRDAFDRVTASARLLPTTGPYMLPDLFPQVLGGLPAPRDPFVWELSRFATSARMSRDGRVLSLSDQTLALLESVFDLARCHQITGLLLVTSIGIERLMLRARLNAHRIAPPANIDGSLCVAVFIGVPDAGQSACDDRVKDL
jgi:N-acyl-L-homoserine lactone synthetase